MPTNDIHSHRCTSEQVSRAMGSLVVPRGSICSPTNFPTNPGVGALDGTVWLTVDPGLGDTPSAAWRGGEMMTETLDSVDQRKIDHQELVQAKADGVELVGPNGLLNELTANVLETVLGVGMEEHLGYGEHLVEGCEGGDSRNGRRVRTVLTEIGPVQIQVPRDTDARDGWGGRGDRVVLVSEGSHERGERGPCRRRVRRIGVQGHHQSHHRRGARRHGRMVRTATGHDRQRQTTIRQ
jgi:Transposase, Mutator family